MSYTILSPPFTLKFREMSAKELKEYNAWFHEELPARVAGLEEEVRSAPGHADFKADRTPGSLDALGAWFGGQVETRPRTPDEVGGFARSAPWLAVPDKELTNRSFSLAFDIGLAFGQAVLHARPKARWDQPLDDKKFADYGQPVIVGLGVVPLNPIRIAVTLAYGIADGRRQGSGLRRVYDYWVKQGS